jgi:hypothetical protein
MLVMSEANACQKAVPVAKTTSLLCCTSTTSGPDACSFSPAAFLAGTGTPLPRALDRKSRPRPLAVDHRILMRSFQSRAIHF